MREEFLHYVWQFQKFDKKRLQTHSEETLHILKNGFLNSDSGPDFLDARLKIGQIEWEGQVEIHIKSSDWYRHQHHSDAAYQNVILHVVWEHDQDVKTTDGKVIPTLVLDDKVPKELIENYQKLHKSIGKIPCEPQFTQVSEIKKMMMLERTLMRRLQRKAEIVLDRLEENKGDWQETAYQTLMVNFGFKLNADAFGQLAKILPFKLLRKYRKLSVQLEALLFGMAGFLEDSDNEYQQKLFNEFKFLSVKHGLSEQKMERVQWKFMRTRLGNFPSVRLSQLASLFSNKDALFDTFLNTSPIDLLKFFQMPPSEYWRSHYDFGKESKVKLKGIGKSSVENILVNTVVPILVAYGLYIDDQSYTERSIEILDSIKAERNRITKSWEDLGMNITKMSDSQGVIELNNEFCLKRRCLQCEVGVSLLS
ncbi:DUF2851 family protein [Jiulongibacter sp. NS-SX5]|uniref:DUF2851 family protein n=1 Tax=Jiulongibacter sp. NS-SX5 TaxID=3463854 RepID=UPI0040593EC8